MMTPQEKAVVQAAIKDHKGGCAPEWCGGSRLDPCSLANAIDALIFACPECNGGGHTCPGDGNSISHGDTDCGEHDDGHGEDSPHGFKGTGPAGLCWCGRTLEEHAGAQRQAVWVRRTFKDVRRGDRIRLLGVQQPEATVTDRYWHPSEDPVGRRGWHVVSNGHGKFAHTGDRVPQRGECVISLDGRDPQWMDPAFEIEIEVSSQALLDAIETLGWDNRN